MRTGLMLSLGSLLLVSGLPTPATRTIRMGNLTATIPVKCFVTVDHTRLYPSPIPANSTGNDATWFITTSGSPISVTATTPSSSGNVSNLSAPAWGNVIPTWPQTVDVDVFFNAGASSSGNGVGVTLTAACGNIILSQTFDIS